MGYTVEVSFNMDKCSGISETKNKVFLHANSCNAESTYEDYEMSGNVKKYLFGPIKAIFEIFFFL